MNIGDTVSVLPPWDSSYPDTYVVAATDGGTCTLQDGSIFDVSYLALVTAGAGAPPPAPPPAPIRITKTAFRSRFTEAEKVAIELASLDNPTAASAVRQFEAALRVYQDDLAMASFIELNNPTCIAGVTQLETAGLIGAGRAAIILNTPPTADELAT